MDAGWNNYSGATLQKIAESLGYNSVDQLPDLERLTQDQQLQISSKFAKDGVAQIQNKPAGTIDKPALEQPKINFGDGSDLALMIADMQSKINDLQIKTTSENIKLNKDSTKAKNDENLKKIQESLEKMAKANKSGLLGKIFGWIGVVVALVVAAAAVVATGGAAAPLVGLAIAGIAAAVMVANETGLTEKMLTAIAGDNDKLKMALQITFAVLMAVSAIAAAVLTGGAGAAGATSSIVQIANLAKGVGAVVGGVASVAGGSAQIASGVYNYEVAMKQADVKENQAWLAKQMAIFEEMADRLRELLEKLNANFSDASEMIEGVNKSNQKIASAMA